MAHGWVDDSEGCVSGGGWVDDSEGCVSGGWMDDSEGCVSDAWAAGWAEACVFWQSLGDRPGREQTNQTVPVICKKMLARSHRVGGRRVPSRSFQR